MSSSPRQDDTGNNIKLNSTLIDLTTNADDTAISRPRGQSADARNDISTSGTGTDSDGFTAESAEPCHFFRMPAELRNRIYEFTYAVETDVGVDLLTTQPPAKSMLLACRQLCAEAKVIYKESYRKFWKGSRFFIDDLQHRDLSGLRTMHLEHVTSLTVRCGHGEVLSHTRDGKLDHRAIA